MFSSRWMGHDLMIGYPAVRRGRGGAADDAPAASEQVYYSTVVGRIEAPPSFFGKFYAGKKNAKKPGGAAGVCAGSKEGALCAAFFYMRVRAFTQSALTGSGLLHRAKNLPSPRKEEDGRFLGGSACTGRLASCAKTFNGIYSSCRAFGAPPCPRADASGFPPDGRSG